MLVSLFFYWHDAILLSTIQISEVLSHQGRQDSRGAIGGIKGKGVGSSLMPWLAKLPPGALLALGPVLPTPDMGIRAPAAPTELLVTPLCQVPEKQGKQECSQLCHWPARSQGHSVQWDVSGQVAC